MSPREFGLALDDPRVAQRLAKGRPVRLVTADTALEFMGEPPLGTLFLKEIEAYLSITGIRAYKLGFEATGDRSVVTNLLNGLFPYLGTIDTVRRWIGAHSKRWSTGSGHVRRPNFISSDPARLRPKPSQARMRSLRIQAKFP